MYVSTTMQTSVYGCWSRIDVLHRHEILERIAAIGVGKYNMVWNAQHNTRFDDPLAVRDAHQQRQLANYLFCIYL